MKQFHVKTPDRECTIIQLKTHVIIPNKYNYPILQL